MKITGVDLFTHRLPVTRPLVLKHITITERCGCLIKLTSESGAIGWGEAAPLPAFSSESLEEVIQQLNDLAPRLIGLNAPIALVELTDGFHPGLCTHPHAPSVQCALEMAVLNVIAAHESTSLARLLHKRSAASIPVNGLITDDPAIIESARTLLQCGFNTIKMKVGRNSVSDDIDRVRKVSEEIEGRVVLRLDANRAWQFDEAIRFAESIADFPIEYIEEPLADATRLPEFCSITGLAVALDESLIGMSSDDLLSHDYSAAVILKPTLLGGLERTAALARAAHKLDMKIVISSSFESSIGIAALAQFAAAYSSPDTAAGLDTLNRFAHDLLSESIECVQGRIDIAQTSKAARSVDESRLQKIDHG